MQVSKELFLNVKQHLQINTTAIIITIVVVVVVVVVGRCDAVTWWSLSFSSQMIRSTSSLLSFLTVCTSADVDRCCSGKSKRGSARFHNGRGVPEEMQVTWTRLRASRRKLKSPNKKNGAGGWRASDILQTNVIPTNQQLLFTGNTARARGKQPVDDVSESVFAVRRVNGRTGVAGDEVGGVVEEVDVDQVQSSVTNKRSSGQWNVALALLLTVNTTTTRLLLQYCTNLILRRQERRSQFSRQLRTELTGECSCQGLSL